MRKQGILVAGLAALFAQLGCQTADSPATASNASGFSELPGREGKTVEVALPATGAVSVTNTLNPDLLRADGQPFTLGPGDRVEIEIVDTPNSRTTAMVGADGKLYFHLLPGIDVWGMTLGEARDRLEKELGQYLTKAQIYLTLREVGSKYVWVLGRLNKPGILPMTSSMTLIEALSLSGGPARSASQVTTEDLADLRHSFLMRQGELLPVDFERLLKQGDLSQNVYLKPDDFIYVPSSLAQEVYVLGAVKTPRAVPYRDRMSLVSAISGAESSVRYDWFSRGEGIFMKDAYLSHVAIVRGSLARPKVLVVNYSAILKGHAMDVPLEPGDIIFVPNSPYRLLKSYVNMIINTFVTTVAANEGLHAGGGGAVGISLPVGGVNTH